MQNSNNVLEAKKIEKNVELDGSYSLLALDSGVPQAPGERKREGSEAVRCRRYRKELGDSRFGQEVGVQVQHASHHLRWGGGVLRAILRVNLVLASGFRTSAPNIEEH